MQLDERSKVVKPMILPYVFFDFEPVQRMECWWYVVEFSFGCDCTGHVILDYLKFVDAVSWQVEVAQVNSGKLATNQSPCILHVYISAFLGFSVGSVIGSISLSFIIIIIVFPVFPLSLTDWSIAINGSFPLWLSLNDPTLWYAKLIRTISPRRGRKLHGNRVRNGKAIDDWTGHWCLWVAIVHLPGE